MKEHLGRTNCLSICISSKLLNKILLKMKQNSFSGVYM